MFGAQTRITSSKQRQHFNHSPATTHVHNCRTDSLRRIGNPLSCQSNLFIVSRILAPKTKKTPQFILKRAVLIAGMSGKAGDDAVVKNDRLAGGYEACSDGWVVTTSTALSASAWPPVQPEDTAASKCRLTPNEWSF